jgi:hypothetical protein
VTDADCTPIGQAGDCQLPLGQCKPTINNAKTTTHPALTVVNLTTGVGTTTTLDTLFDAPGVTAGRMPLLPTDMDFKPGFGYVTSVSHHDGRYFMYAQSNKPNDYGPTVVASSASLVGPWTVEGTALPISEEPWEDAGTESGTVLRINNQYVLFYAGGHYIDQIRLHAHDAIGVAFSSDGLHFTRSASNPILSDPSASLGNTAGEAATERTAVPCDARGLF